MLFAYTIHTLSILYLWSIYIVSVLEFLGVKFKKSNSIVLDTFCSYKSLDLQLQNTRSDEGGIVSFSEISDIFYFSGHLW
jgi:hypothetical protein